MLRYAVLSVGLIAGCSAVLVPARAEDAELSVREITVFKDGHALVVHEGDVDTDENGNVTIDYVPVPVIGTFWAHSADDRATLRSIAAGSHKVTKTRTARQTRELLQANTGRRVLLRDREGPYSATIVDAEIDSSIILLRTDHGTKAVPADSIQEVTFLDDPKREIEDTEIRNQLRLELDWGNRKPAARTKIGMSYVQRGIRWIPNYRLHLNDDGTVLVQLQATLLNELTDLTNVTAHLLVGVPSFEFKGTVDPIALQQTMQQLSVYFTDPRNQNMPSVYASNYSNSMMLNQQVSRMGDFRHAQPNGAAPAAANLGPDIAGAGANEDMFVFTVDNISLAKGERMIVHVGEWTMKYEDVYRLELPATPPVDVQRHFNSEQQRRLARLYHAPKAKHVIRVVNSSSVPLTTAPALFMSDRSVLGQGMMTFTSPGGRVDLPLTTAINVAVAHQEDEVGRKTERKSDGSYIRVAYEGTVRLRNFHNETVTVEVVRDTLGVIDSAGADGEISKPGPWTADSTERPDWWNWYAWPYWWYRWNARGRVEWTLTIPAGDDVLLPYKWHYFWRT